MTGSKAKSASQKLLELPYKATGDSLIVLRMKREATAGGIILAGTPDRYGEALILRGKVLAVGPGRYVESTGQNKPMEVSVGDIVLYTSRAGIEMGEEIREECGADFKGTEIIFLREHVCVAVLKKD